MIKFLKITLLFIAFYANASFADIMKVNKFDDLYNQVCKADITTLVLFDVDKVLIVPTDEFVFEDPIRWGLFSKLVKKYPGKAIETVVQDYYKKRTVKLLDSNMKTLLETLEKKKIPTTALTQWQTGKFGTISKMEDLRFKELNQVGISFAKTSPFQDQNSFSEFKSDNGPMVKFGTILTGSQDKGLTLQSVLAASKLEFKKIVFVDDRIDNLDSVEKICKKLGIQFHGIHYTAADLISMPILNKAKEKQRFDVLDTEHSWLTNKELELRLHKNKKLSDEIS